MEKNNNLILQVGYVPPTVKLIVVKVEKGFNLSGDGNASTGTWDPD